MLIEQLNPSPIQEVEVDFILYTIMKSINNYLDVLKLGNLWTFGSLFILARRPRDALYMLIVSLLKSLKSIGPFRSFYIYIYIKKRLLQPRRGVKIYGQDKVSQVLSAQNQILLQLAP